MKKYYLFLWALMIALTANGALVSEAGRNKAIKYRTKENILYYDNSSTALTEYMRERCRLDLYYTLQQPNFATVVWFHGGGLRARSRYIPEKLKNQKLAVVAVNYRLHPKVTCPAYIEDAAAAVAWVFKNIAKYGGNPELIFVSGHSAGGYLTSMVGLEKRWLAKHHIDADAIAGLIPVSGHTITHYTVREERDIPWEQPIVDEFAPLFHVRSNAPPIILITGDRRLEFLGRYEENAYFMRMMKVVGHKNIELYELRELDHEEMVKPACSLLLRHIKYTIKKYRKKLRKK